ncbi:hypothetical protein TNCV_3849081 [Trichonephila clavipes]|uniref:Uncharacterized protein n=1 Tax=Trichonephila clavipes TaxID=2585209 RepID=A0A8X6V0J6_TRICX|nr:hypothetical protein TNCV_3849081 [Trichonephila clavipes]
MNEDCITKMSSMPNAQPISPRRKGRPNPRWMNGPEKDLLLRTKNWRVLAGRRVAWKKMLLEKAKGCGVTGERRNIK